MHVLIPLKAKAVALKYVHVLSLSLSLKGYKYMHVLSLNLSLKGYKYLKMDSSIPSRVSMQVSSLQNY